MNSRKFRILALLSLMCIVLLIVAACGEVNSGGSQEVNQEPIQTGSSEIAPAEEDPRADWPEEIVFAIIPTEDVDVITRRYEPLIEYLEAELGVGVEVFIGSNYTAVIEAMRNDHVDIASYGPFSYVLAHDRANAEAFAIGTSDPDAEPFYTSMFITLEDSGIESISDLEGRSFGYVDPASTSGHLFPKSHLLDTLGLEKEEELDSFFRESTFTGGHEASVLAVLNGDVEAAAVSSSSIPRRLDLHSDHPNYDKVIVFDETRNIPRSPIALKGDLPESFKEAVKDAFFNLINEEDLAEFREISNLQGGYVPVEDSKYDVIRETAKILGLDLGSMD